MSNYTTHCRMCGTRLQIEWPKHTDSNGFSCRSVEEWSRIPLGQFLRAVWRELLERLRFALHIPYRPLKPGGLERLRPWQGRTSYGGDNHDPHPA